MTTEEIKALVIQKANQYGINPNIALAQIQRESGFNPNAVGGSGERGLAQFMKGTWERSGIGYGSFDNAFDPVMNLDAWGRFMTYLYQLFGGDYQYMLIGYNGGEGHLIDPGKYGPASQAAQNYAQAILAAAGINSGAPDFVLTVTPSGKQDFPWFLLAGAGLLIFVALSD